MAALNSTSTKLSSIENFKNSNEDTGDRVKHIYKELPVIKTPKLQMSTGVFKSLNTSSIFRGSERDTPMEIRVKKNNNHSKYIKYSIDHTDSLSKDKDSMFSDRVA